VPFGARVNFFIGGNLRLTIYLNSLFSSNCQVVAISSLILQYSPCRNESVWVFLRDPVELCNDIMRKKF